MVVSTTVGFLKGRNVEFKLLAERLNNVPHTPPAWGKKLYEHVLDARPRRILELGFAHGVSLCYMAGALDELGQGKIIGVDLPVSSERSPRAEELLHELGLLDRVDITREPGGYLWALKMMLEADERPEFDFCFVDGSHDWRVDGYAFYLVDKVLRAGGWILFDDLDWTFASSPGGIRPEGWPDDMWHRPHMRDVFELLVMEHPSYTDFKIDDRWGWGRKDPSAMRRTLEVEPVGALKSMVRQILKARRRMKTI